MTASVRSPAESRSLRAARAPGVLPDAVIETALADVQGARATWTRPDLIRRSPTRCRTASAGSTAPAVRRLLDGLADRGAPAPDVQQVGGELRDLPVVDELRLADGGSAYEARRPHVRAAQPHRR